MHRILAGPLKTGESRNSVGRTSWGPRQCRFCRRKQNDSPKGRSHVEVGGEEYRVSEFEIVETCGEPGEDSVDELLCWYCAVLCPTATEVWCNHFYFLDSLAGLSMNLAWGPAASTSILADSRQTCRIGALTPAMLCNLVGAKISNLRWRKLVQVKGWPGCRWSRQHG